MNKKNLIIPIILILIGLVSVGFVYLKPEKKIEEASLVSTKKVREIIINASKFKYDPSVITVKKDERIKLIINNTDTLHGVRIPELGVKGNDFVEFVAGKTGEFAWYCNNFCGQGHQQMQGKLIVE